MTPETPLPPSARQDKGEICRTDWEQRGMMLAYLAVFIALDIAFWRLDAIGGFWLSIVFTLFDICVTCGNWHMTDCGPAEWHDYR